MADNTAIPFQRRGRKDPEAHIPLEAVRPARAFWPWLSNILVFLFGVLITIVAFEVCYRIATTILPAQVPWQDRPAFFYLPEDSPDRRNQKVALEKDPNTYRIAVVGDSFTFGGRVQYDDTFPKRIERMLNVNSGGKKVEVLNLGVPGRSTRMEVQPVKKALQKFHADLVILQLTLNDAEEKPYHVTHAVQNKEGKIVLSNPIFRYWKSLGFLVTRYYNAVLRREYSTYHNELFSNPHSWGVFASSLKKIKHEALGAHVPLVVVVFPMFGEPLNDSYPFKATHEKLMDFFRNEQVEALDLFNSYRGIPPERLQAQPGDDAHPNEIGHRIAAESIYKFLLKAKILPQELKIRNAPRNRRLMTMHKKNAEGL